LQTSDNAMCLQLNSNGGNPDTPTPYGRNASNLPGRLDPYGVWHPGFPSIRLAQTASLQQIENTFQAVILDTPIANGWVHSPYKQPVGARLARSALASAYGDAAVQSVVSASASQPSLGSITITVSVSSTPHQRSGSYGMATPSVDVRSSLGFEVLANGTWQSTPIVRHEGNNVILGGCPHGARAIRYLWYMAPCTQQPYRCAIYVPVPPLGSQSGEMDWLPLGPFVQSFETT
jgi:hypothetical protein